MPFYEFHCLTCQKRFEVRLSYAEYGVKKVTCPHCHSHQLRRVIGRLRVARSEEQRLEELTDPSTLGDIDENDPQSLARAMKKMGQSLGEDLPPEFNEITERLEAGEAPEEIEKSMPQLSGEASAADDLDAE